MDGVAASAGEIEFDVSHVSLAYPRRGHTPAVELLHDVSVQIERGSTLTIVGPSGSGKSTLLRCLNRLEEVTGGTVAFRGENVCSVDPLALRRKVALVLQTPVLFEGTVRGNLCTQPRRGTVDLSDARLTRALEDVGLDASFLNRTTDGLSGGERQRVTIARALLGDPDALLLDEPTASLDPPNSALVVETVSALQRTRGLTIVAVTHQIEFVRRLGGCLLYLAAGRVAGYERVEGASLVADPSIRSFLFGDSPRRSA